MAVEQSIVEVYMFLVLKGRCPHSSSASLTLGTFPPGEGIGILLKEGDKKQLKLVFLSVIIQPCSTQG